MLELEREPKRRARARYRSEVEVSGKLTHMDGASQQRLDEAFATFFFQTAIPFHIADCSSLRHLLSLAEFEFQIVYTLLCHVNFALFIGLRKHVK